ncbi:MAG TPA: OmpW family outer membrane protein [Gemmatimonadales bacterium]|nr:OmpW family outer membrane protein [Gemmatimonadales bacterium]
MLILLVVVVDAVAERKSRMMHSLVRLSLVFGFATYLAPKAAAQAESGASWLFTTRILMTGSSDNSDPPGYQVYSAFTLEASLRRMLGRSFAAEVTIRTESREVDSLFPPGENRRLGSLELLPLNLFLQYRLRTGSVRPYAGVGLSATFAWEKSGVLDSTDMKGSAGPALQLGADFRLSSSAVLNADLKWNRTQLSLSNGGRPLTDIQLDPLSLGVGVGFRF